MADAAFRPIPGFAFGDDEPVPASEANTSDPAPPVDTGPSPMPPPLQSGPAQQQAPLTPLPAPAPAIESPSVASRRAGLAILLAGASVGAGAYFGGAWGAGSGLFLSGAAMNSLRARRLWTSQDPTDRGEAIKTTVMLVLGVGLGGYLGYRAQQSRAAR